MSFRYNLIAVSILLFASFSGASRAADTADTKPIVRETCVRATYVSTRQLAGHPGKGAMFPKRSISRSAHCPSVQSGKPLILASYTDEVGGRSLKLGRTELALEQIGARKFRRSPTTVLTNQCVARTVLRQWEEARSSCDAAVDAAIDARKGTRTQFGTARRMVDRSLAVAYSNRAVMHWLMRDATAAHNDLAKARGLLPSASYVTRNSQVTGRIPSLAQSAEDLAPIG
jgi:hypothetical protein